MGTPTSTVTYGYTDSDWGDLLTQYNGQTIEYDEIGNPLFVKNGDTVVKSYTWSKGRQLATMTYDGTTYYYVLNGQGDVLCLTDSTGKMVIGYIYSAYGIPTPPQG